MDVATEMITHIISKQQLGGYTSRTFVAIVDGYRVQQTASTKFVLRQAGKSIFVDKTTAHILWSGKAAIVHHNYLRTWLIKFFCKPREVGDRREIVAASGIGIDSMTHVILGRIRMPFIDKMCLNKGLMGPPVIFQDKMDKEAKQASIVGEGATHQERMLHSILDKFFNNALRASRSISHKRLDEKNIGFLPQSTFILQSWNPCTWREYLSSLPFVHLNMASMYILYRVCSSQSMGNVGAIT